MYLAGPIRRTLARFGELFYHGRRERELAEELESHLALQAAEYERAGLPPAEARRRARLRLGGLDAAAEACRDRRGLRWLDELAQDLRFGLRQMRRSPGFAVIVILTLALGIGANTAIFNLVEAVLLRPLPFPHARRLVVVYESNARMPMDGFSYPVFDALRRQSSSFSAMAGFSMHALTLTGAGEPADVPTMATTPAFFQTLEVHALAGRGLDARDGVRGAAPVAVISARLWRRRFGADPKLIGHAIELDRRPFTLVGIMPAGFRFPLSVRSAEIWIPLPQDPFFGGLMQNSGGHFLTVIARRRAGISPPRAEAALRLDWTRLARQTLSGVAGWSPKLMPLHRMVVARARRGLLLLLGAAGLLLLLACVNLTNLLLARATARGREMALRMALGASSTRLLRQLLTESGLLAVLGCVAGVLLAAWSEPALKLLAPAGWQGDAGLSPEVLAFAAVISAVTCLLFGLAPAFAAVRGRVNQSLQANSARAGESRRAGRLRGMLAAGEIALALVLLAAAGLLLRSLADLYAVTPGFQPRQLMTAEVSLPRYVYSTPQQWRAFAQTALSRLRHQPGMRQTAWAAPLPLDEGIIKLPFSIPGAPSPAPGATRLADYVTASSNYFRVMRIPLLAGRVFHRRDRATAPPVAIISQSFARRYFPGINSVGRSLIFGFPPHSGVLRKIVGVVGDVRDVALARSPAPMMYVPFAQAPIWGGQIVTRTALPPAVAARAIRRTIVGIDNRLPVTSVQTLPQAIRASIAQPRLRAGLVALFGVAALLLALVGIFGVISCSVAQRTQEIGVRMALGSTPRRVALQILCETARLAAAGVAVGLPAAWLLSRGLSSLLYGVRPGDPLTYGAVVGLLLLMSLLAAWMPARRAARVDPVLALRQE